MSHTLIFDIGKTNKKLFVFDQDFRQLHKEYIHVDEIQDEDGFPADNLSVITEWIKDRFDKMLNDKALNIEAINFSTYGASFVHLDHSGKPLTPLYNYLKPFPKEVLQKFHARYGSEMTIASQTASPPSGMLNSGFQLYWLKQTRPEVFRNIHYSLHFPQYLSYLFTGLPVSDFTSIGCHTGLWHYAKKDYHDWVYGEDIDRNLAPIVPTDGSNNARYGHKTVRIGVGIHDSSAALLPYLKMEKAPFLLISTGTWSISLNPFSEEVLTEDDLQNDCLNYMRIDGRPVKAARLFLGNEYKLQVKKLCTHFGLAYGYHRNMKFDESLYLEQKEQLSPKFRFDSLLLHRQQPEFSRLADFQNFESAFHRLMIELMDVQADFARRAIGQSGIEKIYIDGGFADNDIFVKLISRKLSEYKLRTTQAPLGSAVGAALVISGMNVKPGFLKKQYAMRKIEEVLE